MLTHAQCAGAIRANGMTFAFGPADVPQSNRCGNPWKSHLPPPCCNSPGAWRRLTWRRSMNEEVTGMARSDQAARPSNAEPGAVPPLWRQSGRTGGRRLEESGARQVPHRQGLYDRPDGDDDNYVTVGQLHSVTGTMAISETGSVEAERLAISQINDAGGILGRKIKIIQEDGASDWPTFAEKAKKLLINDKVASVFGCWTSASRKAVLPIFEKENGMLYYPTFYEGLEASKNVIYTGQEATQQIIWGLNWAHDTKGSKTFFLIGSDYIWPRTSNKIARIHIEKHLTGCKVVGEEYYPLGYTEFGSLINKVKLARPNCIYSIIVGGSNVSWYKQLHAAGITGPALAKKNQILLTISTTEDEMLGHRRRERRGLLRLHEVLPEPGQPQQQEVRPRLQDDVGYELRHRRRDPGRLPRAVAVEADGREGRQLRHRQDRGGLARAWSSKAPRRLRAHRRQPPPVLQGPHRRDAEGRPVQGDRRVPAN